MEILSGVRFGYTLGSPVTLVIRNQDWANWQDRMAAEGPVFGEAVTAPRPGHADLTGVLKYGREDVRDILERASARETAIRTAVGAVLTQLLSHCGIVVRSRVIDIGGVSITSDQPEEDERVQAAVAAARGKGDTLGGIFAVTALGMPPGLGSHVQWTALG